jgi:protein-L-isoaspartate(D-aspartate) O-methyltransferase
MLKYIPFFVLYLVFILIPGNTQVILQMDETPPPSVEQQLEMRSEFPRVSGWCQVSLDGKTYCGEVLKLEKDEALVRIFDTDASFEWPEYRLSISELKPTTCGKHASLRDLIDALKTNAILKTERIEEAFRTVKRELFCPENPYWDGPCDIGSGMIISSPHIHILMLELCSDWLENATAILDVGSGSGHLTALFAQLAPNASVTGIEWFQQLVDQSQDNIDSLSEDLKNKMTFLRGNGLDGCTKNAPYNIINVGFMCKEIPQALVEQLAPGGILIVPVGDRPSRYNSTWRTGDICVIKKLNDGSIEKHTLATCTFVIAQE